MTSLRSNPRALAALLLVAVGLVVAGGWFLLVSPKRERSASLDDEIATVQTQIATRRADLNRPSANVRLRASDRYRLAKAMPDRADMAGVILDLTRVAQSNGVSLQSIQPAGAWAGNGYTVQPVVVSFEGRFGSLTGFLRDVRTLVGVRKGTLDAKGRLYAVDQVDFGAPEGEKTFPLVRATFTVNAYTFTGASAPQEDGSTPGGATTTTESDGSVAAGATP